jgi:hypothetical protein
MTPTQGRPSKRKPAKRRPKVDVPDRVGPDPCTPFGPDDVNLDDPVERVAVAMSLLSWHTPEDVENVLATREPMVRRSWAGPGNSDDQIAYGLAERSVYRRRAAVLLRVYGARR